MTLHHFSEGLLQCAEVQRAGQAHGTGQVVGAAVRVQLPQEPHAPLCVGQRLAIRLWHIGRNRKLRKVDPFRTQTVEE